MRVNGIISAMLTPLNDDESINEAELRNQVNRQIKAGVAAVFCLGTNGEFYAFDKEEKKKIIDIVVDEADNRVPVLAGTGCITTSETIELTDYAKDAGVSAVSVISPYFAGISQKVYISIFQQLQMNAGCQLLCTIFRQEPVLIFIMKL